MKGGANTLNIASIASGSNGNCYYLENGDDAVLVDAGVSAKQIAVRMARLGLSPSKLRGVFISHEHSDHIRGLDVLTRKYAIPVFITRKTYAAYGKSIGAPLVNFFSPDEPVTIGKISVHPFLKSHDAAEPCSFSVSSGDKTVAVLTDIGSQCANVMAHLNRADAVFLESNYDDRMLRTGFYPPYLKKRIASDTGHLSNTQAARLALEHASVRLRHVLLSHLSANNNTPELALAAFHQFISQRSDLKVEVTLTSRQNEVGLVSL
ncbi:MAG: MBL fold metallo-hydrolase [Deltaproteobacteria bacterium]